MRPIYLYEKKEILKGAVSLPPKEYSNKGGLLNSGWPIGNGSSMALFPVPYDNAVGTNDMGNALTIISFPKGKIEYDKSFKNAVDRLEGSGVYLRNAVPDLVGFAQVRRFVLFDLKNKLARQYRIEMSIGNTIERVALADAGQRRFFMEIEEQKAGTNDPWASNSYLKLIDLSGEKHKVIKEVNIGAQVWAAAHDRLFLWEFDDKKLQVFNMNLEPAHHPLEEVINKHKNNIKFDRIFIHPRFPFAILDGGMGTLMISWGNDRDSDPKFILGSGQDYSISPDGKWVAFKYHVNSNSDKTYLMPISEKYPHYLGSPILLRDDYFNDNKTAWTTKPTAFVGSDRGVLYRWDLENQDFPEKGRMSFYDYTVQKDLEKLTREKKQGLGGKH